MNGRIFMTATLQQDNSRSYYVKKNVYYSIIYQILNLILKFVLRTIFIRTLGKSYLGISGVFSNVLTVLSLSELGVGAAIIYDMYEPIASKNYKQVNDLMGLYKKLYAFIGLFILIIGSALTPFLKYIINDVPDVKYIKFIYFLNVLNTASTYFFAHYRSLITAYQKNYINTINNIIFNVVKVALEAIILIKFNNYIMYIIVEIIVQFLSNFQILYLCRKMFPYINGKSEKIEKSCLKRIMSNSLNSFSIKLGGTIVNATDNIIISAIIGTAAVGVYYNYSMIISVITATTMLISSSAQASVGNLCAGKNNKDKLSVFYKLQFVYCLIYGICFIGIVLVLNSFMMLWLGNDYVLPVETVCLIGVSCYLTGIRQPLELYVNADGMFKYYKFKPWIEAVINLAVSIVLGKTIGLNGIFIGTIVSNILTSFWYEPFIVFRKSFKSNIMNYYVNLVKYVILTIVTIMICNIIFNNIIVNGVLENLMIKFFVCCIVYGLLVIVFFGKTDNFKYCIKIIKHKE